MRSPLRKVRTIVASAIVGLALTLSGCSSNSNLPTMGGATGTDNLVKVAKAYFDCMTAAEIPVELVDNGQGAKTMVIPSSSSGHEIWWRSPQGMSMSWAADGQTPTGPAYEEFQNGTGAALFVDQIDKTDVMVKCLDSSGYNDQDAMGQVQINPEDAAKQVDANNKWAACAREHGWPDVQDSKMPTKTDGSDWPQIVLPNTITEEQLRQLIKDCPNFNVEQAQKMADQWKNDPNATGAPADYVPDPLVTVDYTSLDGLPEDQQQAEMERLSRLQSILFEAQLEFYNSQGMGPETEATPESTDAPSSNPS